MMRALVTRLALTALIASSAAAQADSTPRPARLGPPARRIATATIVSKQTLGAISGVRELPDGRVLLNDVGNRRLLLLDTALATERVVLDSASELENTYGNQAGVMIAHRADSTLFIDRVSLALLVIDPVGRITRVRSVPRAQDLYQYAGSQGGMFFGAGGMTFGGGGGATSTATDARGRLVYRVRAQPTMPARRPPRGVPFIPPEPDSAFIVALDLDTRNLDTLGAIQTPKVEYTIRLMPRGGWNVNVAINPLPLLDEWTVMPDGSVAFVRGIDYRVEYWNADGTHGSTPKIPFDWQPLSQEDKEHLVDSVRTTQMQNQRTQFTSSLIRWVNTYDKKYPEGFNAPGGYVPPAGFKRDWKFPPGVKFPDNYIYGCASGEEPKELPLTRADTTSPPPSAFPMMPGAPTAPARTRPSCIPQPIPNTARVPDPPGLREVTVVAARELPDFRPPFGVNSARADMDGNLWIRTNPAKPVAGGPIFDVVSRQGELIDRLQLPTGYQIAGFGRNRVVYVAMRDATGVHLAKVRLK